MRPWIMAFLISLTIPFRGEAYTKTLESECTPVDLRNETLGPIRNQGEISWCYAFTAADVLQHTFGLKEIISAADLAISYNTSTTGQIVDIFTNHGPPHQTGFNLIAFKMALAQGYCPEEVLPSEKWIKVTEKNSEEVPLSVATKEIHGLIKKKNELTLNNLPFYYQFKNVGKKEFLSLIKQNSPKSFYNKLRNTICKDDKMPFQGERKVNMHLRGPQIFSSINHQLSLGHLVSMDYDARILENRNHRGINLNELHTSSLVGRRWNRVERSCEYLIRDSYGDQCTDYDPSYACEGGEVWISEKLIYPNLTSIVYLLPSTL
jgi:hypothetical protein